MRAGRPTGGDSLRIAVDATPLLGPRSGVGAVTFGVLEALAGRPDLVVCAYTVSWRGRAEVATAIPPGVAVAGRPMPDRPLHLAWQRLGRPPIEWWIGAVDVVHGTNYDVPPARRAARVVTVHDLSIIRFPELCQPATLAYPARLQKAIEGGAWVHTASVFVAEEVVDLLGADPARVRVVNFGVPAVASRGATVAEIPGRYILAVGTVEARKDYPTLVRAFDRLAPSHPDVQLVIAGGDGGARPALDAAVAAAHHRSRIVILGRVNDARRDALLHGACLLAYPSRYEGFGLPPLEAMAAGIPVVATTGGALPEILGDGAVLVPVADADALAAAMAKVLDDGAARDELVARGQRWVARYRWSECAEGLHALYRDAVDATR